MTREKKYEIRLESILIYLKKLKKTKIPLDYFEGILEKAFEEFLPAIALQVYNPRFLKIIRNLTSFLRSNAVHACMLNAAAYLELSIINNEYPGITAYRLRKFFIPILHLLKKPQEKENEELEVVRKILEIMSKEKTQVLLLSLNINNDNIIKNVSPFVYLTVVDETNYQNCKVISDLALISDPTISTLSPTLLLKRRNSCSELFPLPSSEKKEILITSLIKSKKNFQHFVELSESCINESKFEPMSPKQIKFISPAKVDFYSESPGIQMMKKSLPRLFSGQMGDLDRSSEDSENSAQNDQDMDKADLEEEKSCENNKVYDDNALELKFSDETIQQTFRKIHPFIDCFESLLSIETEENSEKN